MFLKEICHSTNANQKVKEMAKLLDIELSIGNNFNWIDDEDEHLKEEGIFVDENLILFLEKNGIEFSDEIKCNIEITKEDGTQIDVYLKDKSGLYSTNLFTEYYDVDGISNFGDWIDFNNLIFSMKNL